MEKKTWAVYLTATKIVGTHVSSITTLDFINAVSKEEALGIAYTWGMKKYPNTEGYSQYFADAKLCPHQEVKP